MSGVRRASGVRRRITEQSSNNRAKNVNDETPTSRRRRTAGPSTNYCQCSRNSTCLLAPTAARSGCACGAAGHRCTSCLCSNEKRRNQLSLITTETGRFQSFFAPTPPQPLSLPPPAHCPPSSGSDDEEPPPASQPPTNALPRTMDGGIANNKCWQSL